MQKQRLKSHRVDMVKRCFEAAISFVIAHDYTSLYKQRKDAIRWISIDHAKIYTPPHRRTD
ncbi:hypothetical protein [Brucella grignonensis]|uniref:Uncharacterized protein n=1 Tax=Brucella grignonensis TaxID=94627 RepID=A0A256FGN7_9HYPH|nr:hypothetical protein [Brucella grignonensis]OYR13938.1 hypothetical protein CEV33_0737 [Brucella grignonensis]